MTDLIRKNDALECFMGYDRTGDIKDAIDKLGAGDGLVERAIAELQEVVHCRCHEAYTGRGLHDPDCQCDSQNAVHVVAAHIVALTAQNREMALDVLASSGQAQEAYAAQIAAEAERDALRERVARLEGAAARDVLAERARQVEAEGWTPEHDDMHQNREMAIAAGCYAIFAAGTDEAREATDMPGRYTADGKPIKAFFAWQNVWPWDRSWWKPTSQRRDLVKAGALILAEIERLDRAAISEGGKDG